MSAPQNIAQNLFEHYGLVQNFYDELVLNMSQEQKKSAMTLGLVFSFYLQQVNAGKRSRGRPKEKLSIDQKRASMILSICNNHESRMAITKWIQLVQKIEDGVDDFIDSYSYLPVLEGAEISAKRYFPKTVQLKSLENSVFRGMKLLGIKFNSYQKNNQYFSMVSRS